jgi:hypothetical protein
LSRNAWVATMRPQIIGETAGWQATADARRENKRLERHIELRRKKWRILPPENMVVIMLQDSGAFPSDLTLSLSHEAGRMLLHRRLARIVERDGVNIDAVIDGSLEDVHEALNLRPADDLRSAAAVISNGIAGKQLIRRFS